MSALSSLNRYETLICRSVEELGYSCKEVQNVLQTQYGIEKGASLSSIYQFSASRNIHRFDYGRWAEVEWTRLLDQRREGTARQTNPHVYYAKYAQKYEKLIGFGVTEVIVSDGFSGKHYMMMCIESFI